MRHCVITVVVVVGHIACVANLFGELFEREVRITVGGAYAGVEGKTGHEIILVYRGVGYKLVDICPCLVGPVLGEQTRHCGKLYVVVLPLEVAESGNVFG